MSVLENEITKYKKKGFKPRQKRTLKYGKRVYLKKERGGISGWLGGFDALYIYYAEGDSNTNNIREFLKDYSRFYEKHDFDTGDKGKFMCSGKMDKRLFRDLKKALVRDEDISRTISVKTLPRVVIEKRKKVIEEEKIKERITEREITRRKVTEERISFRGVLGTIKKTQFIKAKKERGYENQLYQFLRAKKYPVVHERLRTGARFDLVLGEDEVAIELKIIKSSGQFNSLYGQIARYKDYFEKVVIVLIDEMRNPSVMNSEIKRLQKIDPKNIVVITK